MNENENDQDVRQWLLKSGRRITQKTRPRIKGDFVVDSWPADDGPPTNQNDAGAWDRWRNRQGYAGG